jgi:Na+-transporting methylmalonyl-CoA/oxaloacetate decarboxylase gamma subunit
MNVSFLKSFFFLFLLISYSVAKGQATKDLRINEILVKNDSNYLDSYGVHSGWFELFNTGYSTIDVGGCYVTNDMEKPTKYRIPKGDPRTKMAARTYSLFYAYNSVNRGIFHVNFSLDENGFLAIFDQSGRVLIDSVSYDLRAQNPDISFGKMENEPLKSAKWYPMKEPTPNAINYTVVEKTRAEKYAETDKRGVIITVTAMSVVFVMLLLLAIIFKQTGKYFRQGAEKKKKEKEIIPIETKEPIQNADDLDLVAIATALHLYFDDRHEVEQTGFRLNRSLNQQMPWAAKHILFKKSRVRK